MAPHHRSLLAKLFEALDLARPTILGALLTAVSMGLRRWELVGDGPWPRMADFAQWVTACEPALGWKPGTLVAVYRAHRQESAETVIEASAIGLALCAFMKNRRDAWEGTLSDLLEQLDPLVADAVRKDAKRWPRTPRGLRGRLERLAPDLRRVGLTLGFFRSAGGDRSRIVCIQASRPSRPSSRPESTASGEERPRDGCDESQAQPSPPESPGFRWSRDGWDGRDVGDAATSAPVPDEHEPEADDGTESDEEVIS